MIKQSTKNDTTTPETTTCIRLTVELVIIYKSSKVIPWKVHASQTTPALSCKHKYYKSGQQLTLSFLFVFDWGEPAGELCSLPILVTLELSVFLEQPVIFLKRANAV